MKLSDFKPTPYRYELADGNPVLGETRVDGVKFYLIEKDGKKVAIKTPGLNVKCLDADFDGKEPHLLNAKSHDHGFGERIDLLEQRITQLENLLNIDKGKDKIN